MKTRYGLLAMAFAAAGCGSTGGGEPVTASQQPPLSDPNMPSAFDGTQGMQPVMAGMGAPPDSTQDPMPNAMPNDMPGQAPDPTADPSDATDPGAAPCTVEGLKLEGLMYSPGGTVLPFPCEPFHPTLNNPYAVRCVDAWPWYDSGYLGDEYCILPPEPGKGIQIGVHPQGTDWYAQVSTGDMSGYKNPPPGFILGPGKEEERNFKTSSSNTAEENFYRAYVRMRAGSHHMIVSAAAPAAGDMREAWTAGNAAEGLFGGVSLPGAQRPDDNVPKSLEKPMEDAGLYTVLGPDRTITYDMHHFNPTDGDNLKEAWENFWWEEDATIRVIPMFGMPLSQAASTFAQPGQTVDMHYSWNISREIRLIQLFGHRHAWTSNFTAWVETNDGTQDIVYQSFDWYDQPTYRYDSVTMNPAPMPERVMDGGHSGIRMLKPGEQLHFNCHMEFTPERAAAVDAPLPSSVGPLRFANQAFTGEMCILFGSTAGVSLGQPAANSSPVPDFATVD